MKHLAAGWLTVGLFLFFGDSLLSKSNLDSVPIGGLLFVWLLGVILWCAFGVIVAADHLAEMLGEPYGTLILTFSIVAIEVMLISTVMLGGGAPTVGRDTMFAVTMIVLNGVIGLSLVVGGLKHHTQDYSLPGASAYLSVIIPLVTIALILPSVTTSTDDATLTSTQSILFAGATIVLYVIFILIQTGRHRDLFVHGPIEEHDVPDPTPREIGKWVALLVAGALPIVLLSKSLDKVVDKEIELARRAGRAVGRADRDGRLHAGGHQRAQGRLCQPAPKNRQPLPRRLSLDARPDAPRGADHRPDHGRDGDPRPRSDRHRPGRPHLLLSIVTFSGPKTTVLEGAVHLLVFFVYIVLVFSP